MNEEEESNNLESFQIKQNKNTRKSNEIEYLKTLNFKEFNIREEMKDAKNFSSIIVAKRRSGKTTIMRQMLFEIKDWYNEVYIFSKTIEFQCEGYDFVDKKNQIKGFDEKRMTDIWLSQKETVLKLKKAKVKQEDFPTILFIMDDIITEENLKKSKVLQDIFVLGRHSNIAIIILSQNFCSLPPIMRKNVDLAIAFYLINRNDTDRFVDEYLSTESDTLGRMILREITGEEFKAIIVKLVKVKRKPDDYIFYLNTDLKKSEREFKMKPKETGHNLYFTRDYNRTEKQPMDGIRLIQRPIKKYF